MSSREELMGRDIKKTQSQRFTSMGNVNHKEHNYWP
jgi:hypothetical protein